MNIVLRLGCAAGAALLLTAQAPAPKVEASPEEACRTGVTVIEAALPKVTDVRKKRKAEGELREMKTALDGKQWADCMDALDEAKEAIGA